MVRYAYGTVTEMDRDRLVQMMQDRYWREVYGTTLGLLQQQLEKHETRSAEQVPRTLVTMRSEVQVRDLEDDERSIYTLVYPHEANIMEGKISVLAPLGRELLGRRAGEIILVQSPIGPRRYKIEKVVYQPEAEGRFDL